MSEVKRFDHVNHAHVDDCEHIENPEGAWVKASDYDALVAKLAMAEDAAAKGDAARQQCGGMEMEIEELRAEIAALRARAVVVPERLTNGDSISRMLREIGCDGDVSYHHAREIWNACLDELARLNGKTVSEGLLRLTLEFIMATNCQGSTPLWLIEELRALLNQDKENGNG
ncbi:TPA: hypothetical protein VDT85_000449 [Pseudomonas aeruginosa]|uniref:hypothetical protein n=1 Tax=Pseudomonas aeruginosa TaxID=287 RepID=UPI000CF6594F|nr:hypothetical protein [Pseudomonas aeruginosa]MBH9457884.1 hypothetical protein [Pseudomonas aeruginosa]MBH9466390.1 hypothetical protein [Pseudomonas aeruginosa]MBI7365433.1 hypothetical protein [Pseudomonas aeruginosa]PQM13530.1 hypothetical protein C5F85_06305 [Pseudomonas aeruginosa]QPZ61181.1 hypothetical protein I9X26_07195 [Pseudomonas aeruginosa]